MSVFSDVNRCTLLHSGGEAQIYRIEACGKIFALKWYASENPLNFDVIEKLCSKRVEGAYRIVEYGKRVGRPYLVYDFIEGVSSDGISPMPVPVALNAMRILISRLKRLSDDGFHHGDLNPSNVVFEKNGNPVLIDCGIVGPGALAYAAPERLRGGAPNEKSDLFSLGLLLYFWITGENLLKADSYDEFVLKLSDIDSLDVSLRLYEWMQSVGVQKGDFEKISKLLPVWKGALRKDPEARVEDLEELDEILEIAFDETCGGSLKWVEMWKSHVASIAAKIGTECFKSEKNCELPREFAENPSRTARKWGVPVFIFILVLVGVVLFVMMQSRSSSVDDTGNAMLQRSRALDGLEQDSLSGGVDSLPQKVLENLPLPE